jgi:hypothetical protein
LRTQAAIHNIEGETARRFNRDLAKKKLINFQ